MDLNRPVRLPDLEHQRSVEELSRLVLGVHVEAQREAQGTDTAPQGAAEGAEAGSGEPGAEGMAPAMGACSMSTQPGPSHSSVPPEPQPFVLPLGVMARNEVYPRTCKMW